MVLRRSHPYLVVDETIMKKYNGKGRDKRSAKQQYEEEQLDSIVRTTEQREDEQKSEMIRKTTINKSIKYKNPKQKDLVKLIHENQIVFIKGSAGTGKTLMALKAAIEVLQDTGNNINKITLTKPIVEAGESIGFLPGDADEKTQPYMKSFEDNIKELIGKEATRNLIAAGVIEAMPLSFIRGNTFRRSVSILDEAQNTTPIAMKLFVSRIGETSKMIIIGDTDQTDLMLRSNEIHGLADAFNRFKGVKGVGFFEFTEDDIVRSEILIDLMKRYRKDPKA